MGQTSCRKHNDNSVGGLEHLGSQRPGTVEWPVREGSSLSVLPWELTCETNEDPNLLTIKLTKKPGSGFQLTAHELSGMCHIIGE